MYFKFKLLGVSPTGTESVTGEPEKVWHSTFGKRNYPGTKVEIVLATTVRAYIELLNKIPDGVVYDERKEYWAMAAAIVKSLGKDRLIVKAGRQGRGVAVEDAEALVEQTPPHGHWVVTKWTKV
jgi:hypothetical protein